ncbi:putative aminopeptidase FrvX [Pedobacter sp. W3I1]|nr:putative aminopeptidase FrvX [Pedobacter sp. W3I1]
MAKKKDDEKKKHVAVVTKKSLQFLEEYINNPAPTGYEWEGQKLWLNYLKPYIDEHFIDNYGTAVGVINPKAAFKVVIEAHADEISWYVNYITADGLIYVIRNGGSDHQIAPSKRVNIHTEKGLVKAVFGLAGNSHPPWRKRTGTRIKKYLFRLRLYYKRRSRKIRHPRRLCNYLRR